MEGNKFSQSPEGLSPNFNPAGNGGVFVGRRSIFLSCPGNEVAAMIDLAAIFLIIEYVVINIDLYQERSWWLDLIYQSAGERMELQLCANSFAEKAKHPGEWAC